MSGNDPPKIHTSHGLVEYNYFVQLSWPRINIIPAKLAAMHQCLALLARL